MSNNLERFNFGKPVPFAGEIEERLVEWLRDASEIAPKNWAGHIAFQLESGFEEVEALRVSQALDMLPDPAVSYRIEVQGMMTMTTMLVFPRQFALALVSGMLGDPCRELPEDRELTVVEESLAEYFVQEYLIAALQETWRGIDPIQLGSLKKEGHAKYTRLFLQEESLLVSRFGFQTPFGKFEACWMAPTHAFVEQFVLTKLKGEGTREKVVHPRLEALVRELPVAFSVCLGEVEVPLSALPQLRPGDLMILNQSVTKPLPAALEDEQKFLVWPGRVGSRQAVQIESAIGG